MIFCKIIAEQIRDEAVKFLEDREAFVAIVSVGNSNSFDSYTKSLIRNFENAKVSYCVYSLDLDVSLEEFSYLIEALENANYVTAILVNRPLPKILNDFLAKRELKKDLDDPPCTARAVIEILKETNIPLDGKDCLIIGRSEVVGKPLFNLLLAENATVTIAHSRTKNIKKLSKAADIVICAVGAANFLTGDMVSDSTVVIDVGINYVNGILIGDCNFVSIEAVTPYVTPVPGGVGAVTSSIILQNLRKRVEESEF